MADLSLPSDVEITDLPIAPWYPGLIASQGEFTGATTYHATAPASWRGQVVFGVNDVNSEVMGARLNTILAAMRGGQRTLALPLPGPTIVEPIMATTVQSIDTEGVLTLNRALTLPDEATDDDGNYISGLWLKIETRLYILHAVPATTRIAVEPVAVAEIRGCGTRRHEYRRASRGGGAAHTAHAWISGGR